MGTFAEQLKEIIEKASSPPKKCREGREVLSQFIEVVQEYVSDGALVGHGTHDFHAITLLPHPDNPYAGHIKPGDIAHVICRVEIPFDGDYLVSYDGNIGEIVCETTADLEEALLRCLEFDQVQQILMVYRDMRSKKKRKKAKKGSSK